jgi:4-amino-4-deoxy-L-arabinose transferase-like glycosyltransferase
MGVRETLLILAVLRIVIGAIVPLTPEEAYHWNYARHLDWSYYDHPPLIAWSIAAGRLLCGDTPLGVRLVPICFSLGTAALAARLAGRFYGERARLWTPLLLAVEPLLALAGQSGFPDSPLLFFWTLSMVLAWKAMEPGKGPWWLAAGSALGAAMLSKYTAVFFGVSMLGFMLLDADGRRQLRTPWPYLGAVASLAVFSPVFFWNLAHDWASFRFQSVDRFEKGDRFLPLGGLKFLGQQWLGGVPLLLPLLLAAARPRAREDRYLLWSAAPLLVFFFALSFKRNIHLLWPLPAFVGLTILMARALAVDEGPVPAFFRRHRRALVALSAAGLLGAGLHAAVFLPGVSPFPGLYGWDAVAVRARELKASMPYGTFHLGLGRRYTCASELAFHLRAPFDVHGGNVLGLDGLQYGFWTDPAALRGRDAVVVVQAGDRTDKILKLLRERFGNVEEAGQLDVPVGRMPFFETPPLVFLLFRARCYRSAS